MTTGEREPKPQRRGTKASLARSLGEAVGHVWRAIRDDPTKPEAGTTRREVSRTSEQVEAADADGQRVTLRRTTIEEVEIDRRP